MSLLWTSDDLVAAMGGRPLGMMPAGVTGISIDSRTLKPGEAFFAIKGDTMDGHDYATAAVKAGAGLLVIAEGKLPALGRLTAPMIVVPDVLAALEKAGIAARARATGKIIAVTGSVGKTSTKEALRHALSTVGTVHASDKSFNNHWGVPLTLARMPADVDYAIFEIGMNHEGEIRPLVKMVRPHIAIITLVAAAHIGHFRSLDDIAAAKAEIFEGIEPGGTALLNRDDSRWKLLEKLASEAGVEHIVGFGEHARANVKLVRASMEGDHSLISVKLNGKEVDLRVGTPGRHVVQNVLAVLGAAQLAGADINKIALSLSALSAEAGRGKRYQLPCLGGTITLIDESYNANPASMKAALSLLADSTVTGEGRRIAVLGDMLELGSHSEKLHAALANFVVAAKADMAFLAGPEMKALAAALPGEMHVEHREAVSDLAPLLFAELRPGDVVMVKSSKGIGLSKIVDALIKKYPAQAGNSPV